MGARIQADEISSIIKERIDNFEKLYIENDKILKEHHKDGWYRKFDKKKWR